MIQTSPHWQPTAAELPTLAAPLELRDAVPTLLHLLAHEVEAMVGGKPSGKALNKSQPMTFTQQPPLQQQQPQRQQQQHKTSQSQPAVSQQHSSSLSPWQSMLSAVMQVADIAARECLQRPDAPLPRHAVESALEVSEIKRLRLMTAGTCWSALLRHSCLMRCFCREGTPGVWAGLHRDRLSSCLCA